MINSAYSLFLYTNTQIQMINGKKAYVMFFQAPRPSVSLYDRFYKLHKCLESLSRELDLPESVVTSKR